MPHEDDLTGVVVELIDGLMEPLGELLFEEHCGRRQLLVADLSERIERRAIAGRVLLASDVALVGQFAAIDVNQPVASELAEPGVKRNVRRRSSIRPRRRLAVSSASCTTSLASTRRATPGFSRHLTIL